MKTKNITVRVYEIGDRFHYNHHKYVLSHIGDNRVAIINIQTGRMWATTEVEDIGGISEGELEDLIGNASFEYIGNRVG